MRPLVAISAGLAALVQAQSPALACGPMATLSFVDSSPGDRFEVRNNSSGGWQLVQLALILEGSAGGLFFDTEPGGPGSSMSRGFSAAPAAFDALVPATVPDGADELTLAFSGFVPGAAFRFTIDLDDSAALSHAGQMRVTESEIDGALARALFQAEDGQEMALEGHFGPDGIAIVSGLACS